MDAITFTRPQGVLGKKSCRERFQWVFEIGWVCIRSAAVMGEVAMDLPADGSTTRNPRKPCRSPDVVQYCPNTGQNGVAGLTRDQHETTRSTTPVNLQNLHPRFKSGRRLQFSSLNSIVCSSRAQSRASELSRIVSNAVRVSGQAWRKSLMEFSFSIVRSEEGRGFQDFHPENARDGMMKPQREAFHYASFCAILLWDITRVRGSGRRNSHWLYGA